MSSRGRGDVVGGVAATALTLLLSACGLVGGTNGSGSDGSSEGAGDSSGQLMDSNVDVDTPQLRSLRKEAGLEPCPRAPQPDGAESPGDPATGTPAATSLPDLMLPCLGGGRAVRLSALRGPLVVNLWASWCGPCRDELPHYQQFVERAAGRVDVLGIDYQDTNPPKALQLLAETGATYPSLADPNGDLYEPLGGVRGLPLLLLVDGQGQVVFRQYLVLESSEQLRGLVEEHLGVRL